MTNDDSIRPEQAEFKRIVEGSFGSSFISVILVTDSYCITIPKTDRFLEAGRARNKGYQLVVEGKVDRVLLERGNVVMRRMTSRAHAIVVKCSFGTKFGVPYAV
jgi:hypothetical protein